MWLIDKRTYTKKQPKLLFACWTFFLFLLIFLLFRPLKMIYVSHLKDHDNLLSIFIQCATDLVDRIAKRFDVNVINFKKVFCSLFLISSFFFWVFKDLCMLKMEGFYRFLNFLCLVEILEKLLCLFQLKMLQLVVFRDEIMKIEQISCFWRQK